MHVLFEDVIMYRIKLVQNMKTAALLEWELVKYLLSSSYDHLKREVMVRILPSLFLSHV